MVRREGKWWFFGPVTELKLDLKDGVAVACEDMALLDRLAQDAGFRLVIV